MTGDVIVAEVDEARRVFERIAFGPAEVDMRPTAGLIPNGQQRSGDGIGNRGGSMDSDSHLPQ